MSADEMIELSEDDVLEATADPAPTEPAPTSRQPDIPPSTAGQWGKWTLELKAPAALSRPSAAPSLPPPPTLRSAPPPPLAEIEEIEPDDLDPVPPTSRDAAPPDWAEDTGYGRDVEEADDEADTLVPSTDVVAAAPTEPEPRMLDELPTLVMGKSDSAPPPPVSALPSIPRLATITPPPRPDMPTIPSVRRLAEHAPEIHSSNLPPSVPPMAISAPPPAASRPFEWSALRLPAMMIGGAVAVALSAAVLLIAAAPERGAAGAATTTFELEVRGPDGASLEGFEVLVDGKSLCTGSPCKIASLPEGARVLRITTLGGEATSPSTTEEVEPVDVVAEVPGEDASSETGATNASAATPHPAKIGWPAGSPPSSKQATTGKGTLAITSSPRANIVVDGRPLGSTPKTISLPAGRHTVVFAGPNGKRRVVAARVAPGATRSVAAKF